MNNRNMTKMKKSKQSGFGAVAVLTLVATVCVVGILYLLSDAGGPDKSGEPVAKMPISEDKTMMKDGTPDSMTDKAMVQKDSMMQEKPIAEMGDKMSAMMNEPTATGEPVMEIKTTPVAESWSGTVLAGNTSPLLEYNKTDYEAAKNSGRLVVLYYYANWCPLCKAEFPKMQEAFNAITDQSVVGFRVNYKDNETSPDESVLAKEHGVAYQHTKVFVRGGERIGKYPDSWDVSRYNSEIAKALAM
jgi:thiol-disulfide isomerase/thioredoxin